MNIQKKVIERPQKIHYTSAIDAKDYWGMFFKSSVLNVIEDVPWDKDPPAFECGDIIKISNPEAKILMFPFGYMYARVADVRYDSEGIMPGYSAILFRPDGISKLVVYGIFGSLIVAAIVKLLM